MSREQQRVRIIQECERRRITIRREGQAWRLRGYGVDLLVSDLASVSMENLQPFFPRERHSA